MLMSKSEITEHVLNCELSIVGNAASIFQKDHGRIIDQFPTIRFNRGNIDDTNSQGARWDFLATAEVNTFEYYNSHNPKFHTLIFTPKLKEHVYKIKKARFSTNFLEFPLKYSDQITNLLDAQPSTGFQILWYLNKIENKNVNIFGFDWKKTPTYYETRNKGSHNFEIEKTLCLEYADQNGWKIF